MLATKKEFIESRRAVADVNAALPNQGWTSNIGFIYLDNMVIYSSNDGCEFLLVIGNECYQSEELADCEDHLYNWYTENC